MLALLENRFCIRFEVFGFAFLTISVIRLRELEKRKYAIELPRNLM